MSKYRAGVLFGEELETLYNDAKKNQFALPAVNTIGTNTINATLETAAKVNSPVIIQFSLHTTFAIPRYSFAACEVYSLGGSFPGFPPVRPLPFS